jgi:Bax protein
MSDQRSLLARAAGGALYAFVASLPLLLAALIATNVERPPPLTEPRPLTMTVVDVPTVELLESWFDQQRYAWPPPDEVPAFELTALPEGLDALDPKRRKAIFFRLLLPIVLAENRLLRDQRRFIEDAFARGALDPTVEPGRSVEFLRQRYRVPGSLDQPLTREILLRRIDEVPVALVLAQAANESGWGTSRFARQANNLFGIWTWDEGAGVVPEKRRAGARHLVRGYEDLRASVRGYMRNINVGHAYVDLRKLRAQLRAAGLPLDALHLASGLGRYSERGDAYIAEIRGMIAANDLAKLEGVELAAEPEW